MAKKNHLKHREVEETDETKRKESEGATRDANAKNGDGPGDTPSPPLMPKPAPPNATPIDPRIF